jgi:hypothetical protein
MFDTIPSAHLTPPNHLFHGSLSHGIRKPGGENLSTHLEASLLYLKDKPYLGLCHESVYELLVITHTDMPSIPQPYSPRGQPLS